jgi:ABC-2 type transport system ATP-binding protein
MGAAPIVTENLSKNYGKFRGIIAVNFRIEPGEVFGYLGPNAAGKTTTIRLLLDFIRPTSGKATLFGLDSRKNSAEIKRKVGYLPGDLNLYDHLSAREMLWFFSNLRKHVDWSYVENLGSRLKCDFSRSIRTLSQGNRQKIGVIQALMHKPDLIILDEPTNGLDPLIRQEFYDLIRELKAEGKSIFISSHILPEVEKICDRVGIIRDGKIVAVEKVAHLQKKIIRQVKIVFMKSVKKDAFSDIENVDQIVMDGCRMTCRITGDMNRFIKKIAEYQIHDFSSHRPGLEEIFLAYYGESQHVS